MKKLVCFLAVLALCLSFAGCKELDELRAQRAYVVEDGVIAMSDGTQFKRLPKCEELYFERNDYNLVYLVEEELPLLLTSFGDSVTKSDDGRFLSLYEEGDRRIYCRADAYEALVQRIKEGFKPETYVGEYWDYDAGKNVDMKLTPEQAAAVDQVLAQTPDELPEGVLLGYDYDIGLYACTKDLLFREYVVSVRTVGEAYYLFTEDGEYYSVPLELVSVFKEIMEPVME